MTRVGSCVGISINRATQTLLSRLLAVMGADRLVCWCAGVLVFMLRYYHEFWSLTGDLINENRGIFRVQGARCLDAKARVERHRATSRRIASSSLVVQFDCCACLGFTFGGTPGRHQRLFALCS